MRDTDGDPAVVSLPSGAGFVFLRLTMARFGGDTAAHCYTPGQARRLARTLIAAADKAQAGKRRVRR